MGRDRSPDEDVARPVDLNPARSGRSDRAPYAIVDIGSNSVRLVVYDQLGRAPLPRFNEKSLCRLGDGLAQTGMIAAENFRRTVEAVRRFRAIADAMGVTRIDATATEAVRRARNGPELAASITAETGLKVQILSGAEEAKFATLGVISGFFRPVGVVADMGGGSLEIAEALDDHVGEGWVSLPLGALPVEASLTAGLNDAKRRIDLILEEHLPAAFAKPLFYAVGGGWRCFAKALMQAKGSPVQVVHGYTIDAAAAREFAKTLLRLPPAKLAAMPGVPERRARTLPAAAIMLDRVLKRLAPERVIFSALGLREGYLYAQLDRQERYLDPLVEGAQLVGLPLARVPEFSLALVSWTAQLFADETPADTRLRVAVCALSDIAWRDSPELRAEESFRRVLQFPFIGIDHAERVFVAAGIHFRYAGRADASSLSPSIGLLTPDARQRAQILGRAILLAYRLSGGVPALLAGARLRIQPNKVRLEVGAAARVPDSEVVADRLRLLASAVGARHSEIVVTDGRN
jgi:exopolyphosphatase/guanosine-5'-triphosphate,3'-diphosphate pyrophosphatase